MKDFDRFIEANLLILSLIAAQVSGPQSARCRYLWSAFDHSYGTYW